MSPSDDPKKSEPGAKEDPQDQTLALGFRRSVRALARGCGGLVLMVLHISARARSLRCGNPFQPPIDGSNLCQVQATQGFFLLFW